MIWKEHNCTDKNWNLWSIILVVFSTCNCSSNRAFIVTGRLGGDMNVDHNPDLVRFPYTRSKISLAATLHCALNTSAQYYRWRSFLLHSVILSWKIYRAPQNRLEQQSILMSEFIRHTDELSLKILLEEFKDTRLTKTTMIEWLAMRQCEAENRLENFIPAKSFILIHYSRPDHTRQVYYIRQQFLKSRRLFKRCAVY